MPSVYRLVEQALSRQRCVPCAAASSNRKSSTEPRVSGTTIGRVSGRGWTVQRNSVTTPGKSHIVSLDLINAWWHQKRQLISSAGWCCPAGWFILFGNTQLITNNRRIDGQSTRSNWLTETAAGSSQSKPEVGVISVADDGLAAVLIIQDSFFRCHQGCLTVGKNHLRESCYGHVSTTIFFTRILRTFSAPQPYLAVVPRAFIPKVIGIHCLYDVF